MMYCRRCNNTHWEKMKPRGVIERLALLRLKRPYRCTKCSRIKLGSIFLNFRPRKPSVRSRKERHHKKISDMKCPRCGAPVRRSHRRGLERLLFFTKAYRCGECETRFRSFRL